MLIYFQNIILGSLLSPRGLVAVSILSTRSLFLSRLQMLRLCLFLRTRCPNLLRHRPLDLSLDLQSARIGWSSSQSTMYSLRPARLEISMKLNDCSPLAAMSTPAISMVSPHCISYVNTVLCCHLYLIFLLLFIFVDSRVTTLYYNRTDGYMDSICESASSPSKRDNENEKLIECTSIYSAEPFFLLSATLKRR